MEILVIDDEKPTLSMFRLFLSAYGYTVFIAESGEEGLDIFNREKPEIVFTDLKMPGMDGLEVLRQIRARDLRSQVIMITGHGDINKAMDALDLEVSDFISKPVEKKALDAALKRAETRIDFTDTHHHFSFDKRTADSRMDLKIMGKLSQSSDHSLKEILNDPVLEKVSDLVIQFDETFSINRQGIYSLINFIAKVNNKNIGVVIRGLSYNYIRFFQMAGLHRIADIYEMEPDEQ